MKILRLSFVLSLMVTTVLASQTVHAEEVTTKKITKSESVSQDSEKLADEKSSEEPEVKIEAKSVLPAGGSEPMFEGETPWTFNGDFTADVSNYQSHGDKSASPYQSTGGQYFSTLNGFWRKDFSEYKNFSGRFGLLANQSDYRSQYENLTMEQFSFTYENGEGSVPYAIDGGDIYASFSPRSLQVPIKGAMIEFQPGGDDAAWQQSVSVLAGFDQGVYRDIDLNNSDYAGVSWLIENEAEGSILINTVQNIKSSSQATNFHDLSQNVTTVAGSTDFNVGSQALSAEAEIGALYGDLADTTNTTGVLENKFDNGVFGRFEGFSKLPLDYSVSYERYGENYRPAGAVITPDQSLLETNIGWKFDNGLRLSGRQLSVESELESINPLLENTYGSRLSGPLFTSSVDGLSGTLDGSYSTLEDDIGITDANTYTAALNLQKVINENWTTRYAFRARRNDNNITSNITNSQDHSLTLDHVWMWGPVNGVISPGIAYIETTDDTRSDSQFGPQFTASANFENHSVSASYQFRQIEQKLPQTNIFTDSATARYVYTLGQHSMALTGDYFHRNLTNSETNAYRVGASYTLNFNYTEGAGLNSSGGEMAEGGSGYNDILLLPALGQSESDLKNKLIANNIATPRKVGNLEIIEERPLPRISLRQQVAYVFKTNELKKHGVIFEPDTENPSILARDFQNALTEMIRKFGRPSSSYENGQFTSSLSEDIASGQFRRLYEWNKDGRALRFGIPRRLDNQVRFELVGSTDFPAPSNPMWGIGQ